MPKAHKSDKGGIGNSERGNHGVNLEDDGRERRQCQGAQIDLIIDRADRIVHLCEIKFCTGPYELKKDYEQKIRERMTLFTTATKCRKTVVNTFITTFGVADGLHKSIVDSEVKLDALFT